MTQLNPEPNNPYASPMPTPLAIHSVERTQPIEFSGEVTRSDVVTAFRNSSQIIVDFVLIAFLTFVLLISTATYFSSGSVVSIDVILITSILLCLVAYKLWHDSGYKTARSLIAYFPNVIGPMQGRFIENRLECQRLHSQTVTLIDKATAAIVQFQVIAITFDMTRWGWEFFPRSCFRSNDFARLEAFIQPLVIMPRLSQSGFDQQLTNAEALYPVPPKPEGGIRYSGSLCLGDLINWRVLIMSLQRPIAWFLLSLTLCLSVGFVRGFGSFLTLILVSICLFFCLLLVLLIFQSFQTRSKHDEVIMRIAGWIAEEGITRVTSLGGGFYHWKAFINATLSADRVELFIPGKGKHVVICKREHFENESDWNNALAIISKHCSINSRPQK